MDIEITEKNNEIAEKDNEIAMLKAQLAKLQALSQLRSFNCRKIPPIIIKRPIFHAEPEQKK